MLLSSSRNDSRCRVSPQLNALLALVLTLAAVLLCGQQSGSQAQSLERLNRFVQGTNASDKAMTLFRQGRDLLVFPQAHVAVGVASTLLHRRGFNEDDAGSSHREAREMSHVPIRGHAVHAGGLLHGRYDDAVARAHATQLIRREKQGHG